MRDYNEIFEDFLNIVTDIKDTELIRENGIADEICKFLHIGHLSLQYYEDPQCIAVGKARTLVFYDDGGNHGKETIERRNDTINSGLVIYTAIIADGVSHWSEFELSKINLLLKLLFAVIGRNRLLKVAERLTYYDTDGYKNIRYFVRHIDGINKRGSTEGCVAAAFNLKNFSFINKQIGRSQGNLVMRKYAENLEEKFEGKGIVCRFGGDNFSLIAPKEYLPQILEHFKGTEIIYDPAFGHKIDISATAGIYEINPEAGQSSDIMDRLLSSSQAARSSKNDDIVYFSEDISKNKAKAVEIRTVFHQALENEEFLVYYQPKISLQDAELGGAEALCRWMHKGKMISPGEFIPVLEQTMDICDLDFYMLDHVCKDIRRWLDEGKEVVRVSVNLSRKHIMDEDLYKTIIDIIDRNNVPHEYIEIELTETNNDVEFRDLKCVVRGLQDANIFTSVDDFGIGYSSLKLIKEIPWNIIKVDRSFLPVEGENSASIRSIMFKYVVAMVREMGLECIVEGVETRSQVNLLKENRCDFAQGFFFDKPMPVKQFEERLDFHNYDTEI